MQEEKRIPPSFSKSLLKEYLKVAMDKSFYTRKIDDIVRTVKSELSASGVSLEDTTTIEEIIRKHVKEIYSIDYSIGLEVGDSLKQLRHRKEISNDSLTSLIESSVGSYKKQRNELIDSLIASIANCAKETIPFQNKKAKLESDVAYIAEDEKLLNPTNQTISDLSSKETIRRIKEEVEITDALNELTNEIEEFKI